MIKRLTGIGIGALIIGVVLFIMLDPSSYIEYLFLVLLLGSLIFSVFAKIVSKNIRFSQLISFTLSIATILLGIFYFKIDSSYGLLTFTIIPLNAIESLYLAIKYKDTTQIHYHE